MHHGLLDLLPLGLRGRTPEGGCSPPSGDLRPGFLTLQSTPAALNHWHFSSFFTEQRFYPDGKLKEKQTYREGKPLGAPVEYDGKGRPKAAKPPAPEPGEKKPGWRKKLGLGGGEGAV